MKTIFWKILSIFCFGVFIIFAPLAFVQADGRIILQIFVSFVLTIITIILWEVTKEAFNQ